MEKLFIIDVMPFLYRGHFVFLKTPRLTTAGVNTSALFGFVNGLRSILKTASPTHVVLAMDPKGPTFRHALYPAYKAQREKMPEDIALAIGQAFEVAEALGLPVVRVEGFEADDVMGTLAVAGEKAGFDVYVATPDKDAAQLVSGRISLYRPSHAGDAAEVYDEKKVCETWHLSSPKQMIDYLALAGDASDNIPGIRGVGEKTAVQLLADYGTLENILAHHADLKGRLADKVFQGREDATLSKTLTTIRTDVPVVPDWEAYRLKGFDREKVAAVCAKYELHRLAKDLLGDESLAESAPSELVRLADLPHDYRFVSTEAEATRLLEELQNYERIAFDIETAARDGSSSAVDAKTCRLLGFSLAVAKGKAWYVDGSLVDVFRPLFADGAKTFVGHNVKFDRTVLLRYGIGFARPPHDTMLAHYCLDASARHGLKELAEKFLNFRMIRYEDVARPREEGSRELTLEGADPNRVLDYAAEDADATLQLDEALRDKALDLSRKAQASSPHPVLALSDVEEPLVKILMDMEREGVRIDVDSLKAYGRELDREILSLAQTIRSFASPGFNPDSPKQLGALLFDQLKLPGGKKTSTGQFSTDEKTLSKLVAAHPVVPAVLEYRACAKLKSTYVDKLPALVDENARVHTTYAQAFTETGRLSSSDPNLQNIPIRTPRGKLIRRAFVARDAGHRLVSADYSQIELRLMAAFSGDEALCRAFREGADIHRETAARVYGVMDALVTDEQRAACKMVNFGIIYGISPFGLSQRLKVSRTEAAHLIETYFRLYPRVRDYMQSSVEKARQSGYAETMLGRRRALRDLSSRNATVRQAAERDAINTPIQGSAADLIKIAMVRIAAAFRREALAAKMVLQIHDELVFDVPLGEVPRVCEIVRREMVGAFDLPVPLDVGIGVGENWLDAH